MPDTGERVATPHVHRCECGACWDEEVAQHPTGTCHGCGRPIMGRQRNARYCSENCRLAHWARRSNPDFTGGAQPAYERYTSHA